MMIEELVELRTNSYNYRCAELESKEVVSLAFSHDGKYLLAQGGAPDYRYVQYWNKKYL